MEFLSCLPNNSSIAVVAQFAVLGVSLSSME